jgi:hypothetical protein
MAVKHVFEKARDEDTERLEGARGNVLLRWRKMRVMKCVEEMGLSILKVCLLIFSSRQNRKLMA